MAEVDEQDTTRATNDAYTGMLAISLVALLLGCVLLYLDWSQYPTSDPPKVTAPSPKFTPTAPGPAGGGADPNAAAPMPMVVQPMAPENKQN